MKFSIVLSIVAMVTVSQAVPLAKDHLNCVVQTVDGLIFEHEAIDIWQKYREDYVNLIPKYNKCSEITATESKEALIKE